MKILNRIDGDCEANCVNLSRIFTDEKTNEFADKIVWIINQLSKMLIDI